MLRIAQRALPARDPEVFMVESPHVIKQGPGPDVIRFRDPRRALAGVQELLLGQTVNTVTPGEKVSPELVSRARVRRPNGLTNDRDRTHPHGQHPFSGGSGDSGGAGGFG